MRIPLNEDCWLGINGVPPADSGANYRQAIIGYVNLLAQYGLATILDLHWAAPAAEQPTAQGPMPDQTHAITFWISVANAFKDNDTVVFDLYNEPYPDGARDTIAAWQCWRDGGICTNIPYLVAGMQDLVNAVRVTGAPNLILLGGVGFAHFLSQWLAYEPTDPMHNIAVSWHNENVYGYGLCATLRCWDAQVPPVAQQVPVVADEIGESDCSDRYVDPLMYWLDHYNVGYLAWTWTTGPCYFNFNIGGASGMALISNCGGTATAYGVGFKNHLVALARGAQTTAPASTAG